MYSQANEDEIILKYFNGRTGSFLDIGANDGKTISNTYALMLAGWDGVYVEASPKAFRNLKSNIPVRKGLYFYSCALGDHDGETILYESGSSLSPSDGGLVSTILPIEMERFRTVTTYEPKIVRSFKWKTFWNHLPLKAFDFISIDIEGMDLVVLSDIDLSQTSLVCVEWNSKDKEKYDTVCKGFKLIHQNGVNLIYGKAT